MMGSGAASDLAGGDADATVYHVISSDDSQVTPPKSFIMDGSFEEKAKKAHAQSSPELTPTGVPYPRIVGQKIIPVDAGGYPMPVAGTPPLLDSLGHPIRPVSTLTEAGVRMQSALAWNLFRMMESDDWDYEPVIHDEDSDVSEIILPKLTVPGILSLFNVLVVVFYHLFVFHRSRGSYSHS